MLFAHPVAIAVAVLWGVLWIRFTVRGGFPRWGHAVSWLAGLGLLVVGLVGDSDTDRLGIWPAAFALTGLWFLGLPFLAGLQAAVAAERPRPKLALPIALVVVSFALACGWLVLWATYLLVMAGHHIQP